jgi:predicted RNA-binding protein
MADNYGFTISYKSIFGERARYRSVFRTRKEATKLVQDARKGGLFKRRNPRVVKATRSEYKDYVRRYQTGKL